MGDISIKGRSPLLNKTLLDKTLKNFRILNRKRRQKAKKVEEYKAEKPMPIEQRPTKQQRK